MTFVEMLDRNLLIALLGLFGLFAFFLLNPPNDNDD